MTAKEYLQKIRALDVKISQLQAERDNLSAIAKSVKGISYSDERVQTTPGGQGFTSMVIKLVDKEREIDAKIDEYVDHKEDCINKIHQIEKAEYMEILGKRYIDYESFEQIAFEMSYSYNYTCKLHGRALVEFEKVLEKTKEGKK